MADNLQMLTPKDIAQILGVHQKTIHLWLRTGKLHGVKISYRAWRILRADLDLFIEQNSNIVPRKKTVVEKENEENPVNESNNSKQKMMKHYIKDIMGE
jgi:excisionase family DNA binding protein